MLVFAFGPVPVKGANPPGTGRGIPLPVFVLKTLFHRGVLAQENTYIYILSHLHGSGAVCLDRGSLCSAAL